MQYKYFSQPFSVNGDVAPIPDPLQPSGAVSFNQGWGIDYERDPETEGGRVFPRQENNWLLQQITGSLKALQECGFPQFIAPEDNNGVPYAYQKGVVVAWSASGGPPFQFFVSLADNNTAAPTDASLWRKIDFSTLEAVSVQIPGAALPNSDIGTIFHPDYNAVMTWQVFSNNGASYSGYASTDIGKPSFDGAATPRKGSLLMNGAANVSSGVYAALRAWAMHNGLMVPAASWSAGRFVFSDNPATGIFRLPDLRGEFPRFWDAGRGVDSGRGIGSWQGDAIRNITGLISGGTAWNYTGIGYAHFASAAGALMVTDHRYTFGSTDQRWELYNGFNFDASRVVPTASENRPRNVALAPTIKF